MHCKPMGGKLYRKEYFVAAIQKGAEIFLQIQNFFLVKINNAYQSLLTDTTLQLIVNPGGSVATHPVSDTVYVQPAHSCICISLNDIRREMLFPETGNKYAMVDPFRQNVPLPKVTVPV